MSLLSIPDILGMLTLMGVLGWLRFRHQDESVDLWFLGLFFILVEAVAVAVYRGSTVLHGFTHVAALDSYLLAGVTFGWAARQDTLSGSRHLPFFILPAVPLFILTTIYGLDVTNPQPYLYTSVISIVLGLIYILLWADKSYSFRLALVLIHLTLWLPMAWLASNDALRGVVYWGLGCMYLLVAFSFRHRVRRGHIGGIVIIAAFTLWGICFLVHPVVRGNARVDGFVEQIWNLQKFFVILGMILTLLEGETELRRSEAMHDALTGLPNRRLFDDRLSQALQRCLRSEKSIALFIVDLDGFKAINDSLGHSVGDQVLRRTAQNLQSKVRSSDTLARCGGDEFCVVVNDLVRRSDCDHIAQDLLSAVEQVFVPETAALSASIGFAMFPEDAADSNELFALADRRMYAHKRGEVYQAPVRGRTDTLPAVFGRRS